MLENKIKMNPTKLVIISHTPHYKRADGTIVGWGPTVREIDYLSTLFESVTHLAPLYDETAPNSAIAYQSSRVTFAPVKPAGGDTLRDKLGILLNIPQYILAMLRLLPQADMVHVRCPANISMIAILLLTLSRHPRQRWIKYAGNWNPQGRESRTYTFQRWWLNKGWTRSIVTVNGRWQDQPSHVKSFFNPCLTQEELSEAASLASQRSLTMPVRLLYVGQLISAKGVGRVLEIAAMLCRREVNFTLDIVGDGAERAQFEAKTHELGIASMVNFHGWLPRTALNPIYASAHLMIFPSETEGWPKVLSEAMAYGVVPIASKISSIPQYLAEFDTGKAIPTEDLVGFTEAVIWYTERPERWQKASQNGMSAASLFSYANYLTSVEQLLDRHNEQSKR